MSMCFSEDPLRATTCSCTLSCTPDGDTLSVTHTHSCTRVNCSTDMEQAATVLDAYDYRLVAGFDKLLLIEGACMLTFKMHDSHSRKKKIPLGMQILNIESVSGWQGEVKSMNKQDIQVMHVKLLEGGDGEEVRSREPGGN